MSHLSTARGRILPVLFWSGACVLVAAVLIGVVVRNRLRERPTVCEESPVAEQTAFTVTPADGEAAASTTRPVRIDLTQDDRRLDPATVPPDSVGLMRVADRSRIEAAVTVTDGGRAIEISPASPLTPATNYLVCLTNGIRDTAGVAVLPGQTAFVTAAAPTAGLPSFEPIALPETAGLGVTCVTVGPDGRLWAAVDDGRIVRFDIAGDGTLSNKLEIRSLIDAARGQPRLIGGLAFDPASTADRPIVWVTHTSFGFINMGDWRGAVSRLGGPGLGTVEAVVVNLPRSARDHILHQPIFGPDGCLYFQSGSMTSFGAPDGYWGWRREHAFSACVVKVDPKKLPARLPVNVKTPEDGGDYNRHAADAPVTVYASGLRVAYDLCWHSSGRLFAPVNGSSPGGNTPWSPVAPMIWTVKDAEHDWLFDVQSGGYYGHPNPDAGHYVLNGGNPTSGPDFAEVPQYPVGTPPDAAWRPAVFDFGTHVSPNGVFEYRGDGELDRAMIVCRYNVGNDLLAIKIDASGKVASVVTGVAGWGDLQNPLDACQDPKTGNVYVSEYGKHAVTLLRRRSTAPALTLPGDAARRN